MDAALYNPEILKLAASLTEDTLFEPHDARAARTSPVCGSRVWVDVRLGADGAVAAFGEKVRACALGQASAAILAGGVQGLDAETLRAAHLALAAWLKDDGPLPAVLAAHFPRLALLAPARPLRARHASILLAFAAAAAAAEEAASALQPAR